MQRFLFDQCITSIKHRKSFDKKEKGWDVLFFFFGIVRHQEHDPMSLWLKPVQPVPNRPDDLDRNV